MKIYVMFQIIVSSIFLFRCRCSASSGEIQTLVVADGGRGFNIGDLYDARTDEVIRGASLWPNPDDFVETLKTPSSSVEFKTDMSYASRLELFDMSLSASLDFWWAEVRGSISIIKEQRSTAKSVRMVAKYRARTRHEKINALNNPPTDWFKFGESGGGTCGNNVGAEAESCIPATHFVSSITYGSDVLVSLESVYKDSYERDMLRTALQVEVLGGLFEEDIELPGSYNRVSAPVLNDRTTVHVYGDLNFNETIPTTVDEAVDFIHRLPQISDGDVPMEIVLSPLSWVTDDFPTIIFNELDENIVRKVTHVFDGFELSEAYISDILAIEHTGYLKWKESLDRYHDSFLQYQNTFSTDLRELVNLVKSGSDDEDEDVLQKKLDDYWDSSNIYNVHSVRREAEKRKNAIKSLLALASSFFDEGITFTDTFSDFMSPTVDLKYDRVYALVLVGMEPEHLRNDMELIRAFIDLAHARKNDSDRREISHCLSRQINDETICSEVQSFVVLHFDSFCEDVCDLQFCPLPGKPELCPTTSSISPCDYSVLEAKKFQCSSNTYTGSCYIDDGNGSVMMSPEHTIHNKAKPFGDCWCSCPKTQVIEFQRNKSAKRLDEDLPRVPSKPRKLEISGYNENEMEPSAKNQRIKLKISQTTSVLNWKITLDYLVPVIADNGDMTFVSQQDVIISRPEEEVLLQRLVAGQSYDISVAGINSIGDGQPIVEKGIQVGHRLTDVIVKYRGSRDEFVTIRKEGVIPAWLDVYLDLTLSIQTFSSILHVTIHQNPSIDSVGIWTYDPQNFTDKLADCGEVKDVTSSGASCFIKQHTLKGDQMLELRVWDDTDLLIAKNKISVLVASAANCELYGHHGYFCSQDTSTCVDDCGMNCPNKPNLSGTTCSV